MTQSQDEPTAAPSSDNAAPTSALSPAARRALAEAAERRAAADRTAEDRQPELGGPAGPEPTRYGDWEKGGIISDF
ncbi:succinate dehydrogenase assembly factor 4 [Hyphomicrobium sp.]|uniref:DUF1674 domain-containing protein n=1 Tax=Hyphomicrobium sp. TaxID=82 RepID=UPI002E2EA80A|nr:succinate dehydrogenase assembly factor 4 [Hyphomicrobium sp.]HEX2840766.1 DUF1674 domain-containing protein [Hyphomicrobium sp.]